MSELKAMGLVGMGMFFLFAIMAAAILALHAPGELVAVAMGVVALLGGIAMVRVIRRYETLAERRKREEILLSR